MAIKAKRIEIDRDRWHEQRELGIGGSDAGTVMGLNPFKSGYDLYLEKTGQKPAEDISEETRILWGTYAEDAVTQMFRHKTGLLVFKPDCMYQHPDYPFMLANLDGWIPAENAILECKTTSQWKAEEYEAGNIPPSYYCQCMHYLAVTGADKAYLAVMIGNSDFRIFEIYPDPDEIEALIKAESDFWNCVQTGNPWIPFNDDDADRSLPEIYKDTIENAEPVSIDDVLIGRLQEVKAAKKALEAEQKKLENEVKKTLKENTFGASTAWNVSWKPQSYSRFDFKGLERDMPYIYKRYNRTTITRTLRIKKAKEKKDN